MLSVVRGMSGNRASFISITTIVLVLLASQVMAGAAPAYPIIFVHGLYGNHTGWDNARTSLISEHMVEREVVAHFSVNADQDWSYSWLPGDTAFVAWSTRYQIPLTPTGDDRLFLVNFDRRYFPWGTGHGADTYSNTMAIMKTGAALGNIIDRILSLPGQEADKVILIGHSMGGLTIREYLQRTDENGEHRWWDDEVGHRVAMATTMATPHHGSMYLAYLGFEPNEMDENWVGVRSTEATRDLRTYHFTGLFNESHRGVYLYGGFEGNASGWGFLDYDNKDVNCDGVEGGDIVGVSDKNSGTATYTDNPDMPLPTDIPYRWVTSVSETDPDGDGVVLLYSQWLHDGGQVVPSTADTVMVNTPHIPVHDDLRAVYRGLDEPDEVQFAFEIPTDLASDEGVAGRITYSPNFNPTQPVVSDLDQYRFLATGTGEATLRMTGFDWSNTWAIEISELVSGQQVIPPVTAQNNPGQSDVQFPVTDGTEYLVTVSAKAQRPIGNTYFFAVDAAFGDATPPRILASADDNELLDSPVMMSAYPNPFNASTTVTITLQQSQVLNLRVFDVLGREVATLANGQHAAGEHRYALNGTDLVSGVYFLLVSGADGFNDVRKLVLMK